MKTINRNKILLILSVAISLLFIAYIYLFAGNMEEFSQRIPSEEKSQFIEHSKNWRNLRYAEIIPVYRKGAKLYMEVYNTVGSNELPQELWDKIDADKLAAEYGAMKVLLNGPRYWVMNTLEGSGVTNNGKVANFGGIEMTQRATLESNLLFGAIGDKLYSEKTVKRDTMYSYWKGNMVYELTSPKGDIYRMQSYSKIVNKNLSIDDLENLGEKLNLPNGWKYDARVLKEDSLLASNGEATVINDDLMNTYQKINP